MNETCERVWSDEQKAIFDFIKSGIGNLVIVARAGTGKTSTAKEGFKYVAACILRLLYSVFNKRNQLEAQSKINDPRLDIVTLSALGYRFVRNVWANARSDDNVEFDRAKQACGYNAPDTAVFAVKKLLSLAKCFFINPTLDDLIDLAETKDIDCSDAEDMGWTISKLASCTLQALELSKIRDNQGRISFNDMLWLPVVMSWVRKTYDFVCVDECQDMNIVQVAMIQSVVKAGGRVMVIGDDRQCIYTFRGALPNAMQQMINDLKATVLPLTTTYRCAKAIVREAQKIVADYRCPDSAPEGSVCNMTLEATLKWVESGDAILSRVNAPLMPICLSLLRQGRAARIEGKDIGKQLSAIVRKLNARTVPQFIVKVENWAEKQINRFRKSEKASAKSDLINDQKETLIAIAEGCSSVGEIESRLKKLFVDSADTTMPAVVLSSVHKAKGLEWNRVALLNSTFRDNGLTQGEESNIRYVAITRAKDTLVYVS